MQPVRQISGTRSCWALATTLTALARPGPTVVTSSAGAPVHAFGHESAAVLVLDQHEANADLLQGGNKRQHLAARNSERVTYPGFVQAAGNQLGDGRHGASLSRLGEFQIAVARLRCADTEDGAGNLGAQYLCRATGDGKHARIAHPALE